MPSTQQTVRVRSILFFALSYVPYVMKVSRTEYGARIDPLGFVCGCGGGADQTVRPRTEGTLGTVVTVFRTPPPLVHYFQPNSLIARVEREDQSPDIWVICRPENKNSVNTHSVCILTKLRNLRGCENVPSAFYVTDRERRAVQGKL